MGEAFRGVRSLSEGKKLGKAFGAYIRRVMSVRVCVLVSPLYPSFSKNNTLSLSQFKQGPITSDDVRASIHDNTPNVLGEEDLLVLKKFDETCLPLDLQEDVSSDDEEVNRPQEAHVDENVSDDGRQAVRRSLIPCFFNLTFWCCSFRHLASMNTPARARVAQQCHWQVRLSPFVFSPAHLTR